VQFDVTTPSGKVKRFERARRAPGVRVIIQNSQQEILLNKEYRYELDSHDWRLPGGKVVDSLAEYTDYLDGGKDISKRVLEAAKRESREEAGIDVTQAEIKTKLICGATVVRDLYYVMVTEYTVLASMEGEDEESDHIDSHQWMSYEEIQSLLKAGEIQEGRTAAVLTQLVFS
jgi:8-oxo-dGTP pyrophosphatase MutT (NUDIX family)